MKAVHVYIPTMRPIPRLLTRDADEGEGHWVTIHGAAVHIGKGGNIDKGPKELVGKSENGAHAHHHDMKAHAHGEAAQGKGAKHPDFRVHQEAEKAHIEASRHFKSADYNAKAGNIKSARAANEAGHKKAEEARLIGIAASKNEPTDSNAFEKPNAHKGLHADAENDVKGSDKHEAEHKRLMGEYGKSKSKWEREAVNQQIAKNAGEGAKANAQSKHHKALALSERANSTQEHSHHVEARQAIDQAREAHERAGGEGVKAKVAELDKMRKPHHAAIQKHEQENPNPDSSANQKFSTLEGARKAQMQSEKPTKVFHHPKGGFFVPPHAKAAGQHEKAGHKVALDYNGKEPGSKGSAIDDFNESPKSHTGPAVKGKAEAKPKGAIAKFNASPKSHTSALETMAARHLKKAVLEAADQDPKHKK